jgi:hypothetical protein
MTAISTVSPRVPSFPTTAAPAFRTTSATLASPGTPATIVTTVSPGSLVTPGCLATPGSPTTPRTLALSVPGFRATPESTGSRASPGFLATPATLPTPPSPVCASITKPSLCLSPVWVKGAFCWLLALATLSKMTGVIGGFCRIKWWNLVVNNVPGFCQSK